MNEKEREPSSEELYKQLEALVSRYVHKCFEEKGVSSPGDYVANWALVVNFGNPNRMSSPAGYFVEAMPEAMPPHAIKGLLSEGINWVFDTQEGVFSDDE